MDSPTIALLQEIIRRESLSLLSYVGDAFPWTARGGDVALGQLRNIVADHKRAVSTLGQFLVKQRAAPPYVGSYPSGFTTVNFLALSHVLPRLIDTERKSLAQLEAEVHLLTDESARSAVGQLVNAKRDHLVRLEALASPAPVTATTPVAS
jgi:hypothetical protein